MTTTDIMSVIRRVVLSWLLTRDVSWLQIVKWLRRHDPSCRKVVRLSCDIEPRQLTCDYLRETPISPLGDNDPVVLSTHYLRRIQTNMKLSLIFAWTRIHRQEICILSTDGLAGARPFIYPYRLVVVSQWFNSPDEADDYWLTRVRLQNRTKRLEIFSERPGIRVPSPSESTIRLAKDFVLADPSLLENHFPSIPQIVFASDITLSLRDGANTLIRRLFQKTGTGPCLDEALWEEARRRVEGINENTPLTFEHLLTTAGQNSHYHSEIEVSEVELDALRLTLHSRERFLFLKSIAQSELAEYLKVIGDGWRRIPEIKPFVINTKRFPVSREVSDLQRSRVCPDFGSSLGSIPLYFRAQTLGGRAIGLIQRRSSTENPLMDGLPAHRQFRTTSDLLESCRLMLSSDDSKLLQEEFLIRQNYLRRQLGDRLELKRIVQNQHFPTQREDCFNRRPTHFSK